MTHDHFALPYSLCSADLSFGYICDLLACQIGFNRIAAPQRGESQTRVALFCFSSQWQHGDLVIGQPSVIIISIYISDLLVMAVCSHNLMTWLLPDGESHALFWFSRQWQLCDTVGPPSSLAALCGGTAQHWQCTRCGPHWRSVSKYIRYVVMGSQLWLEQKAKVNQT